MNDPKPVPINVTTTVIVAGREFAITASFDLRHLVAFADHLDALGLDPPRSPLHFDRTADGAPICPRHGVAMRLREKQGDTWYSHSIKRPNGEVCHCRGFPGPHSPGYEIEPNPADALGAAATRR